MIATICRTGALTGLLVMAGVLFAGSAFAHHSFTAEYDPTKPVKLSGKIIEMKWSNPHGWIYVEVVAPDGKAVKWSLETSGANGLYRRGWRKEDLPAGTEVLFEGWQARNGTPTANISAITFKDGRRLFAGTSNAAAPQQ